MMDLIEQREQARQYLQKHPLSREKLALRLGLSYWWVVRFCEGKIVNTSAEKLQRIYDLMAAEKSAA